ncbi:MAG: nucleoside phosphorylase [Faecousia sp.]
MSFGSMKLTHADGTMHHLGIDETMVAKRVLLTPDPLQVPFYAALMDKAEKVGEYREYVTYTGTLNGKPLSVMSCGFGCMPAAIAVEELNHLGVEAMLKIDYCPTLQPETPVGTLLAASAAVRGEGATKEYIDLSYPAVADPMLLGKLLDGGVSAGLFRSHDCQSLETPWTAGGRERIAYWASLGVSAIDGETSALFVIASILKRRAASLALITENYATGEHLACLDEGKRRLFAVAAEALLCC